MTINKPGDMAQWDAIKLLQIINPDNLSFCCVGYAPSQGRRCRNPIAQHNRQAAMSLLKSIPRLARDMEVLRQELSHLAGLALCRRYHQGQAEKVVKQWYATIDAELKRMCRAGPEQTASIETKQSLKRDEANYPVQQPAARAGWATLETPTASDSCSQTFEQEMSTFARQKAAEDKARQFAETQHRQEAHRQARIQREQQEAAVWQRKQQEAAYCRQEEQEAAQRRRAEQEAERHRQAKREQDQQLRQRRDQERRERAEQEVQAWAFSWEKYDGGWAQIVRLKTMASAQKRSHMLYSFIRPDEETDPLVSRFRSVDWHRIARSIWPENHPLYISSYEDSEAVQLPVKDILPWPVRDGTWQEVNERNVEDFFRHALVDVQQDPRVSVKSLRAQAMRWHPDRILQLLGRKASEDVMSHATLVAQVVNGMIERSRKAAASSDI